LSKNKTAQFRHVTVCVCVCVCVEEGRWRTELKLKLKVLQCQGYQNTKHLKHKAEHSTIKLELNTTLQKGQMNTENSEIYTLRRIITNKMEVRQRRTEVN